MLEPCGEFVVKKTIRSGSGYGMGRSRTVLTTEKIAVFAPTPSARARTAVAVNPGAWINIRRECLRSCRKDSIKSYTSPRKKSISNFPKKEGRPVRTSMDSEGPPAPGLGNKMPTAPNSTSTGRLVFPGAANRDPKGRLERTD